MQGHERGANGSVEYGMLLATFPCRAKSNLSLLEVQRRKGKRMTEEGTLGIVMLENAYKVRYASNNPHSMDRQHYQCTDEAELGAFLQHLDLDAWYIKQAFAELWKGRFAALPIVLSAEQIQEYFAS